jgi:hypothetical protein
VLIMRWAGMRLPSRHRQLCSLCLYSFVSSWAFEIITFDGLQATSLQEESIDIWLDRRLMQDDMPVIWNKVSWTMYRLTRTIDSASGHGKRKATTITILNLKNCNLVQTHVRGRNSMAIGDLLFWLKTTECFFLSIKSRGNRAQYNLPFAGIDPCDLLQTSPYLDDEYSLFLIWMT